MRRKRRISEEINEHVAQRALLRRKQTRHRETWRRDDITQSSREGYRKQLLIRIAPKILKRHHLQNWARGGNINLGKSRLELAESTDLCWRLDGCVILLYWTLVY